jgi:Asp-tRNA(Asn)/Glu-tRNA(Gln) amidotransferase A subunit family amidase
MGKADRSMRRPLDPRNHSKKPEKTHTRGGRIELTCNLERNKVPLEMAINAWNKALKDHESQGHRIVEGPLLESHYSYGSLSIVYTYAWDNLNYPVEMSEWLVAIANYEQELSAWKAFEEDRKQVLIAGTKNIDAQILRAEHRLANLKAKKAGEVLPYPEG